MKCVMLATRPQWVEKICHKIGEDETGKAIYEKRIEVRKSAPKEVPFKCYIYCTYGNMKENYCLGMRGKIIGEFICDKVYSIKNRGSSFSVADEEQGVTNEIARQSCLYYDDMVSYFGNKDGFGWHISDLKIYDKPKELSEFSRPCSYSGLCFSCKRTSFKKDGNLLCNTKITRPPQSWMRVEDLGD